MEGLFCLYYILKEGIKEMSSSGKTAHLGLNQWVLTDPFRMEDFNEDNLKIDGAFGDLPFKKLLDVTLEGGEEMVQADFTDLDLDEYGALIVFFRFQSDKRMRVNQISDYSYYYSTRTAASSSNTYFTIEDGVSILVPGARYLYHRPLFELRSEHIFRNIVPDINTFEIYTTSMEYTPFVAGDRITVWGVKR